MESARDSSFKSDFVIETPITLFATFTEFELQEESGTTVTECVSDSSIKGTRRGKRNLDLKTRGQAPTKGVC